MLKIKSIFQMTKVLLLYLIILTVWGIISELTSKTAVSIVPNIVFICIIIKKTNKSNILRVNNCNLKYIVMAILFSAFSFIAYNKILNIMDGVKIYTYKSTFNIFTLICLIINVIVEEFIFRKTFFSELNRKFNVGVSILIQGIIFGILHLSNPGHTIICILLGISAGIMYYSTKSLLYSIIFHSLYNLYFDILPIYRYEYYKIFNKFVYQNNIIFYISIILQIIILVIFIKSRHKNLKETPQQKM